MRRQQFRKQHPVFDTPYQVSGAVEIAQIIFVESLPFHGNTSLQMCRVAPVRYSPAVVMVKVTERFVYFPTYYLAVLLIYHLISAH